MPITKTLAYDKVSINGVDYTPHLADSAEVTVEPVEQMVRNGQALVSAWDVSFSVDLLDDNVVNAASLVYTNTANSPTQTFITFTGTTGAATLNIDTLGAKAITRTGAVALVAAGPSARKHRSPLATDFEV